MTPHILLSKDQVIAVLAELRVNRHRHAADQHIRHLLRTYGGGVNGIGELSPELYFHVFVAAGGMGSVCAPVTTPRKRVIDTAPIIEPAGSRPYSPLVKDLTEKLAAAKAKTKRSSPGGRVDIGAPAQFGDEDAARDYPSDGRKMA